MTSKSLNRAENISVSSKNARVKYGIDSGFYFRRAREVKAKIQLKMQSKTTAPPKKGIYIPYVNQLNNRNKNAFCAETFKNFMNFLNTTRAKT